MLASRRTGAPLGLALAVVVVVAAVLAGAYLIVRGPETAQLTVRPQQAPLESEVRSLNLKPGRTVLAGGEEGLWVARQVGTTNKGRLMQVDPVTMSPKGQWPLALEPRGLAVGRGSVWVFGQPTNGSRLPVLVRVDAKTGVVKSRLMFARPSACSDVKFTECDPVVAGDGVWVSLEEQLIKVSLDGRRTEMSVPLAGRLWDAAAGAGAVWALAERGLYRIDLTTDKRTRVVLGEIGEDQQANHIAVGKDFIWVSTFPGPRSRLQIGRLALIDISGAEPKLAKTFIYPGAASLALLDGGLWIDRYSGQGELDRVNADDGALTGPIVTDLDDVTRLLALDGELWAVTWNPSTQSRKLIRVGLTPATEAA